MARNSNTQELTESIAGQHLSLAVAAHLARTQLVPDPLKVYDGQHMSDMLNVVAMALARNAPLCVLDPHTGHATQLAPAELEGAVAIRGATQLLLRDGRSLASVTIRRADLRQAVAVLKAVGLQEIAPHLPAAEPRAAAAESDQATGMEALAALLREMEVLLTPPLLPAQIEMAKKQALFIARHSPRGRIANLAMQLMSTLHEPRDAEEEAPGGFRMALARLRAAIEENVEP